MKPKDEAASLNIEVVFADEHMLAVNKPAALAVIPEGNKVTACLLDYLQPEFGKLFVVHRLDRDTSGMVVLARDEDSHRSLNRQFEYHKTEKVYHCIVVGSPEWQTRTVEAMLRVDADREHRTIVDPNGGKPAVTHFQVLERLGKWCLLQATIETGRTHQIRVHAKFMGNPILCDGAYGDAKPLMLSAIKKGYRTSSHQEMPLIARQALHAIKLTVQHPVSGESMTFEAPYPKDFNATVKQLKKLVGG